MYAAQAALAQELAGRCAALKLSGRALTLTVQPLSTLVDRVVCIVAAVRFLSSTGSHAAVTGASSTSSAACWRPVDISGR